MVRMDGDSSLWIAAVVLVLVAVSACFSVMDAAFSRLNPLRLKAMADEGDAQAARVLALVERRSALISSLRMGYNIVNIGAVALAVFLFAGWLGGLGVLVAAVVMAVMALLFGVMLPEIWVRGRAETLAVRFLRPANLMVACFRPLNALIARVQRPSQAGEPVEMKMAEDAGTLETELRILVDRAKKDGGLNASESELLHSAIGFGDLEVSDILTPRVDIAAVEDTATCEEIARVFRETGFSRLPVYHEHIDDIVGVIYEKDFFANRAVFTIERYLKTIPFVSPAMKISALLKYLQENRLYLAVVTDEYGGVSGLVSLEDIVEELVGEIWDEHDEIVEEFRPLPGGACEVSGSMGLSKLFAHYDIHEESDSATVSGWVNEALGKLAEVGDEFTCEGFRIMVTEVENRRVQKIRIARQEAARAAG